MHRNQSPAAPPVPPRRKNRKDDATALTEAAKRPSVPARPMPLQRRLAPAPPPPPPKVARRSKSRASNNRQTRPAVTSKENAENSTNKFLNSAKPKKIHESNTLHSEDTDFKTSSNIIIDKASFRCSHENSAANLCSEHHFRSGMSAGTERNKYPPLFFTMHDFQDVMANAVTPVESLTSDTSNQEFIMDEEKNRACICDDKNDFSDKEDEMNIKSSSAERENLEMQLNATLDREGNNINSPEKTLVKSLNDDSSKHEEETQALSPMNFTEDELISSVESRYGSFSEEKFNDSSLDAIVGENERTKFLLVENSCEDGEQISFPIPHTTTLPAREEFSNTCADEIFPKLENTNVLFLNSSFDDEENELCFRVITTNVPFEKCLGRWGTTLEDTNFTCDIDEKNCHIFEDYMDRSSRLNIRRSVGAFSCDEFDSLEEIQIPRSAPKVRFVIQSPSSSIPDDDENQENRITNIRETDARSHVNDEQKTGQPVGKSFTYDNSDEKIEELVDDMIDFSLNKISTDGRNDKLMSDVSFNLKLETQSNISHSDVPADTVITESRSSDKGSEELINMTKKLTVSIENKTKNNSAIPEEVTKVDYLTMELGKSVPRGEDSLEEKDRKEICRQDAETEDGNITEIEVQLMPAEPGKKKICIDESLYNFMDSDDVEWNEEDFVEDENDKSVYSGTAESTERQEVQNDLNKVDIKDIIGENSDPYTKKPLEKYFSMDISDFVPVNVRRNTFLETMLSDEPDAESWHVPSCRIIAFYPKLTMPTPEFRSPEETVEPETSHTENNSEDAKIENWKSCDLHEEDSQMEKAGKSSEINGSSSERYTNVERAKESETIEGNAGNADSSKQSTIHSSGEIPGVSREVGKGSAKVKLKTAGPIIRGGGNKSTYEAKSDVLNELLCNFNTIRLKPIDGAIREKNRGGDKAGPGIDDSRARDTDGSVDKTLTGETRKTPATSDLDYCQGKLVETENESRSCRNSQENARKFDQDRPAASRRGKIVKQSNLTVENGNGINEIVNAIRDDCGIALGMESSTEITEISADRAKLRIGSARILDSCAVGIIRENRTFWKNEESPEEKDIRAEKTEKNADLSKLDSHLARVARVEETVDPAVAEVNAKAISGDQCAIDEKTPPNPCNNNDNNNRAATPVAVSNDQSRDSVAIVPGSVRNFVKYYEVQSETTGNHSKSNVGHCARRPPAESSPIRDTSKAFKNALRVFGKSEVKDTEDARLEKPKHRNDNEKDWRLKNCPHEESGLKTGTSFFDTHTNLHNSAWTTETSNFKQLIDNEITYTVITRNCLPLNAVSTENRDKTNRIEEAEEPALKVSEVRRRSVQFRKDCTFIEAPFIGVNESLGKSREAKAKNKKKEAPRRPVVIRSNCDGTSDIIAAKKKDGRNACPTENRGPAVQSPRTASGKPKTARNSGTNSFVPQAETPQLVFYCTV